MLKYMTLIRGNAEITYPIYQISDLTKMGFSFSGTSSDSIKFVAYNCSPTATPDGVQSAFSDEIPTTPADYGNITQNAMRFVLDTATQKQYCPSAHFVVVPVGEKPADWDTNYFDYFTYQPGQVGNWGNVPSPVYPVTNPRDIPVWDSTAQYYKADTPTLQERFNHLFFTKAGYSFGVWSMSGQGEGDAAYKHASYIACNPRSNAVMTDTYSYIWRDQNGNPMTHQSITQAAYYAYWRTNCMDIAPPVSGQQVGVTPLTSDRRDMQIFCYCEYNGEMYYGVMAIAIDSNGELTNARALMFTADFWGDSISDNPPEPEPQGGEWGDSTNRRGGDGTFSAPSDNRGDSSGTYLTNYETAMRNALNDGFNNGGVKIYQIAGQYAGDVIGVLFGQDYFDKFLNSMYNPLSAILSYHMIPSSLRGDAFANNIPLTAGGFDISAHMTTPTNFPQINSVKKFHVGSVDIANYFGAYPDFAPHTQAILHLPYIGDITIDINAIMYGTLSVDYFCDNVSGNVAAWIWCSDRDGKCTYKYIVTGNCAYTIPLYSQSQNGGAVGKIMSSGVSLVGGLLSGNAAGAVGGALGIAGGLFDAATTPRNTQTTGGNSGNVSMLGDSVVWLEIIRPQWVNPENYQAQSGIPSQISGKISDFRGGFFQVETVDLENVPATDSEIAELEQILKDGIYYLNE